MRREEGVNVYKIFLELVGVEMLFIFVLEFGPKGSVVCACLDGRHKLMGLKIGNVVGILNTKIRSLFGAFVSVW